MIPKKLAICVTFHFVKNRLRYLDMISDHFASLAEQLSVVIVTNSEQTENLDKISAVLANKGFEFDFLVPTGLGHPFLLTWTHFVDFRKKIKDPSFTHFMYLEDDILVTRRNMEYWMTAREELRRRDFIPSFLRVEKKDGFADWVSSDCLNTHNVAHLPRYQAQKNSDRIYVSLPTPYQGMYLLDRELMIEHLDGPSSVPEYGYWRGIREEAARGLAVAKVRKGFNSRNLVPFSMEQGKIDEVCFIHHTPNNYANDVRTKDTLGTIKTDDLLYYRE